MNRPFKTIRHLLLLLATAAAALCPGDSWADEISYLDYDGTLKTVDATKLTSGTTTIAAAYTLFTAWYYVSGNVTINGDLTVTGSADDFLYIILCDGASLTVTGKINCAASINIYAQSTGNEISGNNTGRLTVQSTADDAISCYSLKIYGGRITVSGGVTSVSFDSGQFLAGKITDINMNYMYASDFVQVGTYDCNVIFGKKMMIGDDPTNSVDYKHNLAAGDDKTFINGKKLSPHPDWIFTVAIDPSITGGTISADRASAVGEHENVTLTLTPAAGFELTDASWSFGGNVEPISASDLATAQSTGKWIFSPLSGLGGDDVTFSATFTPLPASITSGGTTTYFATLAAAIEAGDGETIDVLRQIDESATNYDHSSNYRDVTIDLHGYDVKFGELHKKGSLTIKSTESGGKFTAAVIDNADDVSIDGTTLVCTTSLVSITNVTFTNSTATIKDLNNGNNSDHLTLTNSTVTTTNSLQWFSDYIKLSGGSRLILNGGSFFVGDGSHTLSLDIDNTSLMRFIECTINGYGSIETPLSAYLSAADASNLHVDGSTKNNLVLRKTWSLDLKNAFNEISAGVPAATVQYFDAVATFDPADPTTFDPDDYIPTGNPGANEITAINNSDGKNHYIIMHITPHEGTLGNPDYWTDERLLYVMDGASSAAARSRAPGISLNLPYLLKADDYDANKGSTPADMKPRHDGAGWYYYKLPASHNVANGYTKSTLQGLAAPKFLLSEDTRLSLNGSTLTVTDGTANGWKAELTYDQISFPFDGAGHCPKTKKIVVYNGGTPLITLDSTPASESTSDVAKADAAQAEIAAQITDGYDPAPLTISDYHNICSHQTTLYGWFSGQDGTTHYSITVPFPGSGTSTDDPWLIQGGENIALLSKCVNVGQRCFENEFLKLDPDPSYSYDMSTVSGFEPIGMYPSYPFCGSFSGKDVTISNLSYTYNPSMAVILDDDDPKKGIGLFGQVGLSLGDPVERKIGSVEDVTLLDCTFASLADDEVCYLGSIAGNVDYGKISDCLVKASGDDTGSVSATKSGCKVGALFGNLGIGTALSKNYYDYKVQVSYNDNGSAATLSGYNPRGVNFTDVTTGTDDFDPATPTLSDCAMLWVKKAKLPDATTSGSTVTFKEATTPADADATHPADCYSFSGNDYYYAVDQPVTLSVTTGSVSPDGVRTFYDELETLTMKDGTADTDIKDALGFTMPGTDVTIEATFTPSDWFTINTVNYNATDPSQPFDYNWMTFYHEWTDGTGTATTPANYKVTNYDDPDDPTKAVEVKTVSRVNPADGSFALADIEGGICYSGVPTIFHYAVDNDASAVLPQKLKFTPVDPTVNYTEPTVAAQFKGTVSGKTLTASDKCYILNNAGDFILAYPTEGDDQIAAHKCYIDWNIEGNGNTPAPARLVLTGGNTGIERILLDGSSDGDWYSLDGRRLNGQPARKGIYINKGKKTVIR